MRRIVLRDALASKRTESRCLVGISVRILRVQLFGLSRMEIRKNEETRSLDAKYNVRCGI